jgi:hypothetical protein
MSNRSKAGFLQFRDYAKKSSENYVKLVKSRKDILKAWKNYISSTNHPSVSTFFENQRNNASVNFNKAMNDVEDIERMATITVAMYNNLLNYSDWPHHLSVL